MLHGTGAVGSRDLASAGAAWYAPGPRLDRDRCCRHDRTRALVVTVLDGELPAGTHTVTWDTRDANGDGVPAGSYIARLVADGAGPTESDLFLDFYRPLEFVTHPSAVAGADGTYAIPMDLVAVADSVEVRDELGQVLGWYPVADEIMLVAVTESDGLYLSGARIIELDPDADGPRVDLTVPQKPRDRGANGR
ncbi:MAG: hypothetical protein R6X25_13685 [Candidatus Krumholzibacteriia bacterium]